MRQLKKFGLVTLLFISGLGLGALGSSGPAPASAADSNPIVIENRQPGSLPHHPQERNKVIQSWKVPHIIKGMLTWLPGVNAWRLRHASTGGSNSPRYCYAVWLRHLVMLHRYGFRIKGARICELGPGDSIGAGLAALLAGADRYIGLDVMPFAAQSDLENIFDELIRMYSRRESIPVHNEFPVVRPQLDSYEFPNHAIDWTNFADKVERIRGELKTGVNSGQFVSYQALWTSPGVIAEASLDLVFSQGIVNLFALMQYRGKEEAVSPFYSL